MRGASVFRARTRCAHTRHAPRPLAGDNMGELEHAEQEAGKELVRVSALRGQDADAVAADDEARARRTPRPLRDASHRRRAASRARSSPFGTRCTQPPSQDRRHRLWPR
eukprot:5147268-Pleurochrysis_carterae.AAC.1